MKTEDLILVGLVGIGGYFLLQKKGTSNAATPGKASSGLDFGTLLGATKKAGTTTPASKPASTAGSGGSTGGGIDLTGLINKIGAAFDKSWTKEAPIYPQADLIARNEAAASAALSAANANIDDNLYGGYDFPDNFDTGFGDFSFNDSSSFGLV